ncbi:MAG: guanylate kinase [Gammaproteobacteria bacterium]|nr:guanylate kinase [Gammaproteobacteria bacterium]|tara:strand:+ start:750 stop:1382 length:633 start_codon:yes stop_codon:yes gene_type:complete
MAKLIVIAAPSGAGKTSLIKALLEDLNDFKLNLSISFTTRKKRIDETEGESYFFIDKKEFKNRLKKKEFLENAKVFGNLYGTSRSWVEQQIKKGCNVLLELDWKGAAQVKSAYPSAITIFVLPPSYKELKLRLLERGQDRAEVIETRLAEAKEEILQGKNFDFLIVNDVFDNALADLKTIVLKNKKLSNERETFAHEHLRGLLEEKDNIL